MDTGAVTYFVDEEGNYYQLTQAVMNVSTAEEDALTHLEEVQEVEPQAIANGEGYQTVPVLPSKKSDGEVSYILVVQEESQQPALIDIKKEKATEDVHNFEVDEERAEREDEPEAEPVMMEPQAKKKGKASRFNFTCDFCLFTSHRRYLLLRHMESHQKGRSHKCEVCDRSFKTHVSLQRHTNLHNGPKLHVCKTCDATFASSGELVRHVRYKHTLDKPYKCTECDYAAVELSKLRRHVRSHNGERPYQCTDCTYASTDAFKLKRHQRTHTGEKPYECDLCNHCFAQSNTLKVHQLTHNAKAKLVFACELCPVTCGRKVDLRIHVQKFHTSDQPVKCKLCGKAFPDRYSCNMHIKTHQGEKCYKCHLCPYASTRLCYLNLHLLKHTGEKPFACDECNQTFRRKNLLRRHQDVNHNPEYVPKPGKKKTHTCNECDRTFARKGYLIRHLAVHDPDSGRRERALALKLGRQNTVKYVESETLKLDPNGSTTDPDES